MANKPTRRIRPYYIREPRQLRALVSPLRQEVLDGVADIGPCTIADLAVLLGRTPTALYRHVKRLEKVDLLFRVEPHSVSVGRPAAVLDVPGRPLFIHQGALAGKADSAVRAHLLAMLRNAGRGYLRALNSNDAVRWGKRRNLWHARWKGRLNEEELESVTAHLSELIAMLERGSGTDRRERRLHEVSFVLAPSVSRAPSRAPKRAPQR
ncbi:MAG: helix-turn-helix transcriptional regulator [Gemmatimonadaceae bacterium]|nr:helix-turn-helix transcriptional regulator [Gemmatimonadaceae bacterium]